MLSDPQIVDASGRVLSVEDLCELLTDNQGWAMLMSQMDNGDITVGFITIHEAALMAMEDGGPVIMVNGVVAEKGLSQTMISVVALCRLGTDDSTATVAIEQPDVKQIAATITLSELEKSPTGRVFRRRGQSPRKTWPVDRRRKGWGKK